MRCLIRRYIGATINQVGEVVRRGNTRTFRIPLLFPGLRRFVYLARRGAGCRAELIVCNDWWAYYFNMSMNLEITQQQSS